MAFVGLVLSPLCAAGRGGGFFMVGERSVRGGGALRGDKKAGWTVGSERAGRRPAPAGSGTDRHGPFGASR